MAKDSKHLRRSRGSANLGEPSVLVVATLSSTVNAFLIPHIQALRANCWHVTVAASLADHDLEESAENVGFEVVNVPFSRSAKHVAKHFLAFLHLRTLLRQCEFNAVYTHTPIASLITRLAVWSLGPSERRPAVVYFAHGFHFLNTPSRGMAQWGWYALERAMALLTDRMIVINNMDLESVSTWRISKAGNVRLIRGVGINFDAFCPSQGTSFLKPDGQAIRVACIAEFTQNKSQALLLRTLDYLPPESVMIFAGDGALRQAVRDQARSLGLELQSDFVGHLDDIRPLLESVDVVVLVSEREGLPRSLMEAACLGVPIAVTPTRGSMEVAEAAGGAVAASRHPEAIADALLRATGDDLDRHSRRARFVSNWGDSSERSVCAKIVTLLDDVVGRAPIATARQGELRSELELLTENGTSQSGDQS